ncbi:hypothetical protein NDN11_01490 [Acinetobacter sp. C26M]|uniref:hypothetical protein n=1 Tax=unclassified Acinetobacter TaxID=196816 RepID=UPI0020375382|nr:MULTISPECIES: hypothetical protein [unclassified Acinetobacter]USA46841.1 hypothetical protein NDN11_01490 [Acinetobacter sp. C26M]USA50325.1 hypothetical protein NDN12_01490 [Acinetobacter sp. C26G]
MKKNIFYSLNIFLSFFLVLLLYYKVFYYDYIWDDFILFVNNTSLLNEKLSWEIISRPVLDGSAYFRPLVFLSWFLEFKLLGQSPFYSHLFNILFFYLNSLMTFSLAIKLFGFKRKYLASFVLFLYVINPILIESTVWISGRFDLLASFFILIALNIYIYFNSRKFFTSFFVVFFSFLGLLSKEVAIVFPVLLFCFWAYRENLEILNISDYKKFFYENKIILILIVISYVLYFILRKNALGVIGSTTYNVVTFSELLSLYVPFQAFDFYVKNFILPVFFIKPINPLNYNLSFADKIYYLLTFSVFFVFLFYLIYKRVKDVWMLIATLVTISLVLYVIPFNNGVNVGNMRFMTLGVSFYSIFLVGFLNLILSFVKGLKKRILFIFVIIVFILLMLVNFFQSIKIWQNELVLWKSAYLIDPSDETSKYNYLNSLILTGDFKTVKKILDSNKNGMSGGEQALYAHSLLNMKDKEGVLYYQGLVESLPKYHERYKSISDVNTLRIYADIGLTTKALAAIYKNYAMALLLFNNDFENAYYYQNISKWYYSKNENSDLIADEFVINYLSGNYDKADLIYREIEKSKNFKKNDNKNIRSNFIEQYCLRFSGENLSCNTWKNDKFKY